MKISRKQLFSIVNENELANRLLAYINSWSDTLRINTPLRMCHYLAQCLHETGGLRYTLEQGRPSYFAKYEKGNLAKMLGNTQKGDGYKYRGRGLIHITGRANYQAYQNSVYCKGNIMDEPDLLERPLGAVKSSMWWWMEHGCNALADKDDILAITKKVNGGTNGLEDRKRWLRKCKNALGVQ